MSPEAKLSLPPSLDPQQFTLLDLSSKRQEATVFGQGFQMHEGFVNNPNGWLLSIPRVKY